MLGKCISFQIWLFYAILGIYVEIRGSILGKSYHDVFPKSNLWLNPGKFTNLEFMNINSSNSTHFLVAVPFPKLSFPLMTCHPLFKFNVFSPPSKHAMRMQRHNKVLLPDKIVQAYQHGCRWGWATEWSFEISSERCEAQETRENAMKLTWHKIHCIHELLLKIAICNLKGTFLITRYQPSSL